MSDIKPTQKDYDLALDSLYSYLETHTVNEFVINTAIVIAHLNADIRRLDNILHED